MKLLRDLDGPDLVKALRILGCAPDRQRGSHIRVTTQVNGQHHEVVPNHFPIAVGTLRSILRSVAEHHGLTLDELIEKIEL